MGQNPEMDDPTDYDGRAIEIVCLDPYPPPACTIPRAPAAIELSAISKLKTVELQLVMGTDPDPYLQRTT